MSTAFLGIMKNLTDDDLRLALQAMCEPLTTTSAIRQAETAAENRRVKTVSKGRDEQPIGENS
jgi:hypothetical protein